MARIVWAIAAGTAAGIALSAGVGYLWLCFGADPHNDPLFSF